MGTFINNTSKDFIITEEDFFKACKDGNKRYVEKALKQNKALVTARDEADCTALMRVAFGNYTDIAELLIDNGSDINAVSNGGFTPVNIAASNGYTEFLELLISKGIDLQDCASEAMGSAAFSGKINVLEFFLNKGIYVDIVGKYGDTPLMCAAGRGEKDTTVFLINKGANVNARDGKGETVLMKPAMFAEKYKDIIDILISKGADVNARDSLNMTALDHALLEDGKNFLKSRGAESGSDIMMREAFNPTMFKENLIQGLRSI